MATEIVSPGYQRSPVRCSFQAVDGMMLSTSLGKSTPDFDARPSLSDHA